MEGFESRGIAISRLFVVRVKGDETPPVVRM
jgi:hypothetical protein